MRHSGHVAAYEACEARLKATDPKPNEDTKEPLPGSMR